jgi:hypothetical protein
MIRLIALALTLCVAAFPAKAVDIAPAPGELCEMSTGGTHAIVCGITVKCRAYIARSINIPRDAIKSTSCLELNGISQTISKSGVYCGIVEEFSLNPREEIWQPRREGDSIVCDERDRPSVKSQFQIPDNN